MEIIHRILRSNSNEHQQGNLALPQPKLSRNNTTGATGFIQRLGDKTRCVGLLDKSSYETTVAPKIIYHFWLVIWLCIWMLCVEPQNLGHDVPKIKQVVGYDDVTKWILNLQNKMRQKEDKLSTSSPCKVSAIVVSGSSHVDLNLMSRRTVTDTSVSKTQENHK